MDRLSFDEYGCLLALMAKSRSEDPFTKVGGAAFNKEGRCLATAYNGLSRGAILPDWMNLEENRVRKNDYFIHCEANLCSLLKRGECETVYLTISPCVSCCQNLVALGVKRVVYLKEYHRCNKFKEFFIFHRVSYEELDDQSKQNILNYIKELNNFEELFKKRD